MVQLVVGSLRPSLLLSGSVVLPLLYLVRPLLQFPFELIRPLFQPLRSLVLELRPLFNGVCAPIQVAPPQILSIGSTPEILEPPFVLRQVGNVALAILQENQVEDALPVPKVVDRSFDQWTQRSFEGNDNAP